MSKAFTVAPRLRLSFVICLTLLGSFSALTPGETAIGRGRGRGRSKGRGRSGLVHQLRRSCDSREIESLLEEIQPRTVKEFSMAISAFGRSKDWQRALGLLDEMRDAGVAPTEFSWSAAINACGKNGEWQRAIGLLDEMRSSTSVAPDSFCFSAAISACGNAGQMSEASRIFESMCESDVSADVVAYNALLSACQRSGQWERALRTLDEMEASHTPPDVVSYTVCISALGCSSQFDRSIAMFDRMRSSGIAPDGRAYNAVISACDTAGAWESAVDLLDQMASDGVAPNLYCYNAAINACGKSGEWERAEALLGRMAADGVSPDVITFSAAMSACERAGEWRRGLALFRQMREAGLTADAVAYTCAITAFGRGGRWKEALSTLDEMEVRGLSPTEACFSAAMQALVAPPLAALPSSPQSDSQPPSASVQPLSRPRLDAAFKLLDRVHRSPVVVDSYRTHHMLLSTCRGLGDEARAAAVQAAIERYDLSSLGAVVHFSVGGQAAEEEYVNGAVGGSSALDGAVEDLFGRVLSETEYTPVVEALPYGFVQSSSEAAQVRSLKFHAEKKALATMLLRGTPEAELSMRVNIKVCADCHSFLSHASKLLGRPIRVEETITSRRHDFGAAGDSDCSCGG